MVGKRVTKVLRGIKISPTAETNGQFLLEVFKDVTKVKTFENGCSLSALGT